MTEKKTQPNRVICKGMAADTDEIYQGGWNYLAGKNLNPQSGVPSTTPTQPAPPQTPETPEEK